MTRARVDNREFFAALFDFSFTSFVTLKLVRYAYIIVVAGAALMASLLIVAGWSRGGAAALGSLIVAGLGFLFTVTLARIGLEAAAVFFRIADDAAEVAEQLAQIALNTSAVRVSADT
ncbi:MAG: DUF4282 domain-containing protein [Gemmatimonadaceae bacterium]